MANTLNNLVGVIGGELELLNIVLPRILCTCVKT